MKKENKYKYKLNSDVRFLEVRLIGEGEPVLMSSYEAYQLAQSEDKDLILINENQTPPIVKIEEFSKFIYNIEKAEKEKKKNCVKTIIKEIQLSAEISDHDLLIKAKRSREFLTDGNKIKCVLQLKGRQKANPERGKLTVLKFIEEVSELGILEGSLKLDGSKWIIMIKPIRKG